MRLTRPLTSLALLTVFFLASPSRSEAQLPRYEQQVVVTPTRSESTVDRVAAFTTLVNEDDINASSARDVADLLRQTGAQVTDISGNRRSYRVDLRGFGATGGLNTLVLVDGRRVNEPDLSGTDWAQIPLDRVQRIEVVQGGGAAVLFGDSATGGVINIITKAASAKRDTVVGVSAGSYSSFASDLTSSGTEGRFSYTATARYDHSDGHRENAQTNGGDLGGQVTFEASEAFRIGVSGSYHSDKTGLPGAITETDILTGFDPHESKTPNDFADVDDGYVMVTPRYAFASGYASLDFSVRQRNSKFFSSFTGGEFTGDTGTNTIAFSPKVAFQKPLGRTANNVVGGFDLTNSGEDITNTIIFDGFPDEGTFTLEKFGFAAYVNDEMRVGKATITGGYRYDKANYSFDPSDPDEADYDAHAGSLGATYAASGKVAIFGRVSRSFRYPVLDEIFDFFGNTIQTGLVPQRSTDFEGGARIESGGVQGSVSVFHLSTDDEIFYNPIGGAFGFGANENLDGTSQRTGFALAASTEIRKVLVGGTLTFMDTSVDGGAYDGNSIPGVPATRASINARVPLATNLSLGLEGLFIGERPFEGDFGGEYPDQESYFLTNAKVTYEKGRARIFVDIKNLFDADYSEYGVLGGFPTQRAYYPSPGIHAVAGLEFRF